MWSADKHAMAHGWEKEEELKLILASGALFKERFGTKLLPKYLKETDIVWLLRLSPMPPEIFSESKSQTLSNCTSQTRKRSENSTFLYLSMLILTKYSEESGLFL